MSFEIQLDEESGCAPLNEFMKLVNDYTLRLDVQVCGIITVTALVFLSRVFWILTAFLVIKALRWILT